MGRFILVLLGGLFAGCVAGCGGPGLASSGKAPKATVIKEPLHFASRTFDPNNPPPEMPPLGIGEQAECDSIFLSDANVAGKTQRTDATHAFMTIAQITVTLQLNVTIWTPSGVTPHVMEHEEGHRQIAEHFYQTADQVAAQIADSHMGEVVEISGTDLNAESNKVLQETARRITEEYNKELNPDPAQRLYDSITDHGRNEVVVKDAIASAINNAAAESPQPAPAPAN